MLINNLITRRILLHNISLSHTFHLSIIWIYCSIVIMNSLTKGCSFLWRDDWVRRAGEISELLWISEIQMLTHWMEVSVAATLFPAHCCIRSIGAWGKQLVFSVLSCLNQNKGHMKNNIQIWESPCYVAPLRLLPTWKMTWEVRDRWTH
jgi:hypothetical protein